MRFIGLIIVKNHFKIEEKIFFLKKMTWQLMWRNVRAAGLNATLQLLVIYRWVEPHLGSQLICEVGLGFPTLGRS